VYCSKCGVQLKPIVAVDIDGTLADFHGHLLRFMTEWTGKGLEALLYGSLDLYDGGEPWSDYCMRLFEIDLATFRAAKLAYRQGGLKRSMPPVNGAAMFCKAITTKAELWLTTTRPYLSLDTIVPDTVEWLRRTGIDNYQALLFDEDKYEQLADRVDTRRVVAILDDQRDMCEAAAMSMFFGIDAPILLRNKYNGATDWTTVARDLKEAEHIINARVDLWYTRYSEVVYDA
jgi:hypothetical protein